MSEEIISYPKEKMLGCRISVAPRDSDMYTSWGLYAVRCGTVSPILNGTNFHFNRKNLDCLTFSCESLFHMCFDIYLNGEIWFTILVSSFRRRNLSGNRSIKTMSSVASLRSCSKQRREFGCPDVLNLNLLSALTSKTIYVAIPSLCICSLVVV